MKVCVDGGEYYCVADPKISLDIAFQKIFALRGLHDVGLVCGDVKLANVMIQKENDKYTVRLIDIGSITKKDKKGGFVHTPYAAAPEGFVGGARNKKYIPNQKIRRVCECGQYAIHIFWQSSLETSSKKIYDEHLESGTWSS